MNRLTIDGSLTVHSALIDFTTDSARCVGVFQSKENAALNVEYEVALTHDLIKILSHAFVAAGVPLLRAPSVAVSLPVSDGGHNSNGNGRGRQPPPSKGAACRLCGAALYARAVPLGYCRICRTTRQAECVLPESADATPCVDRAANVELNADVANVVEELVDLLALPADPSLLGATP